MAQADSPGAPRPTYLELIGGIPKRAWWKKIFIFFTFTAISGVLIGGAAFLGIYYYFSKGLPEVPRVDEYRPPILSEFRSDDGYLAAEFFNERRKVVPYEQIPKKLVQAFVAAEDKSFFDHFGVDPEGTGRAVYKTLKGQHIQGGSTLTQQTAKAILISTEGYKKSTTRKGKAGIIRKIREAILSFRLEKALTKEEILYLYLNNVYLGHHSYGVQAAAENYFRKDVRDLTLAEIGLLAGLPQSPTKNPFAKPVESRDRRKYVLRRMNEEGMITAAQREEADNTPVKAFDVEDPFHEVAPFFSEQVRRDVVNRYENKRMLEQGLHVDMTMDSEKQRGAQDAMLDGLIVVDKRQGFYGPLTHVTGGEKQAFLDKVDGKLAGEVPANGGYYPAVVSSIDSERDLAELQIGTKHTGVLPLAAMRWAHKPSANSYYPGSLITKVKTALSEGDVILVRQHTYAEIKALAGEQDAKYLKEIPTSGTLYSLEQEPQLQGAIISIDPRKNYVPAMIGGYDYDASEFNRAFQACRQPGSSFKPLSYSAAIEQLNWTAATVLVDAPIVTDDPDNQMRWKPSNYEEEFKGEVIVRQALMESMNIPAIKTFLAVGFDNMKAWARKLGLTTEIKDASSALGSSCVHPFDMANVYAVFDREGRKEQAYFIRQVRDRYGRVLEDHTAVADPWASFDDRLKAGYAELFKKSEQVMSTETAFLITMLLHDVATGGTGAGSSKLGKPVAGKTGTTNDSHDTWFVGFTHDLVTAVWLGYDDYRHESMGRYEAGSRASLPIWLEYMKKALDGVPQSSFQPAPGSDIVYRNIDSKTGKLARPGSANAVTEAFKRGNEPKEDDEATGEGNTSVGTSTNIMMVP
jgi:penicillin-binding protein 1A